MAGTAVDLDPFVGRDAHLAALHGIARRVSSGQPALIVIRGEAGIGKTRLITEFSGQLAKDTWEVRIGACTPLVGPTLTYGPWTAARRPGSDGAWWEAVSRRDTETPSLDRVGDHVLEVLDRTQAAAPVAVVLEDLHWADRSSLALLAYVVRGLSGDRRVLLCATARDEVAPDSDREFELVLAELLRRDLAFALPVGQLGPEDVRRIAVAVAGPDADPRWLDSVVRRSAGNPYMTRQLAAAGPAERLPAALRAVLHSRLAEVGPAARAVVEVVALADAVVPPRVLEWTLDTTPDALDDAVAACIAAHMLGVSAGGRYEVSHALLRETAVDEVPPGRRERLHGRLADAFERCGPDSDRVGWLSLVAQHRLAAGDREPAIAAVVSAGVALAAAGGHPEAYRLLSQGLRLAEQAPGVDRTTSASELRRRCATEAFWSGAAADAVQLLERELAEPGLSPDVEAGLRLELAKALRACGRGRDAVSAAGAAYQAVQSSAPSVVVARAHAAYAATLMMTGQYRQVDPVVKDALAVLDALDAVPDGDVATIRSNVLNTSGVSRALLGDLDDGVALLRESVELARGADSAEDVCRGLTNLAFVFENAGLFDESVTESFRCIEEARARGVEISAAGLAVCNVLESLVWLGRWEEAEQLATSAAQRPFPDEVLASIHHSAAQLALGRGNLAAAHDHIAVAERAAAGAEAPQLHAQLGGLRAEVALADHDPETSLRIVDETLATSAGNDDDAHLVHLVTVGLQALNDLRRRPPRLRTLSSAAIVDRADTLHGLIAVADPVPAADAGPADAPDPAGDPARASIPTRPSGSRRCTPRRTAWPGSSTTGCGTRTAPQAGGPTPQPGTACASRGWWRTRTSGRRRHGFAPTGPIGRAPPRRSTGPPTRCPDWVVRCCSATTSRPCGAGPGWSRPPGRHRLSRTPRTGSG